MHSTQKKGRSKNLLGGFGAKSWKTRFITIDITTGLLRYFNDKQTYENGAAPKGHIFLAGGKVNDVSKKDYSFNITVVHGKKPETITFSGFEQSHQMEWLDIFRQAMNAQNNPEDRDSSEVGSMFSEDQASNFGDYDGKEGNELQSRLDPVLEGEEEDGGKDELSLDDLAKGKLSSSEDQLNVHVLRSASSRSIMNALSTTSSSKREEIEQVSETVVGGNLFKKGKSMLTPWKVRYVLVDLESGDIQFFPEKKPNSHGVIKEGRGELNFNGGLLVELDPSKYGKDFAFQLASASVGESVELAAFSHQHFMAWKEIFESINSKPDSSTPSQSIIDSFAFDSSKDMNEPTDLGLQGLSSVGDDAGNGGYIDHFEGINNVTITSSANYR